MISERLAKAIQIALYPENYKICEGCDSIVTKNTRICPNCHSYRYNEDKSEIMNQAANLGKEEQKSVTPEDLF